jgi:hypothetical protein
MLSSGHARHPTACSPGATILTTTRARTATTATIQHTQLSQDQTWRTRHRSHTGPAAAAASSCRSGVQLATAAVDCAAVQQRKKGQTYAVSAVESPAHRTAAAETWRACHDDDIRSVGSAAENLCGAHTSPQFDGAHRPRNSRTVPCGAVRCSAVRARRQAGASAVRGGLGGQREEGGGGVR